MRKYIVLLQECLLDLHGYNQHHHLLWICPMADLQELLRVLKPKEKVVCGYHMEDEMEDYSSVVRNPDIFKNRYSDSEVKILFASGRVSSLHLPVE